eukprot:m.445577 g.445577  ORF g.445577 m.445577 type:complete len:136 (+) comp21494_c0_seq6:122-529(+)
MSRVSLIHVRTVCRLLWRETASDKHAMPLVVLLVWVLPLRMVLGSVWTTDATVAKTFVDASDTGTCYVNWCNDVHARICWEGLKQSGNGSRGMGLDGFKGLTHTKSVLKSAKPLQISQSLPDPITIAGLDAGLFV